jgi:hypothetical protein
MLDTARFIIKDKTYSPEGKEIFLKYLGEADYRVSVSSRPELTAYWFSIVVNEKIDEMIKNKND